MREDRGLIGIREDRGLIGVRRHVTDWCERTGD